MNFEDSSASSSSSSSSSSCCQCAPSGVTAGCSSTSPSSAPKRKGGRKKFRETRHPVYHGVRERNGRKWVCEVREPRKKNRIWLGTFRMPEMAAVAHDVAALALRGESARLNFPDLASALPRPWSAAAEDVRRAAAEAAEMFGPSMSSSRSLASPAGPLAGGSSGRETNSTAAEEAASPPPPPPPPPPPQAFVDEEALFNMPVLLEDMARGLMLTPPALQKGFDWDAAEEECLVDASPLWTD